MASTYLSSLQEYRGLAKDNGLTPRKPWEHFGGVACFLRCCKFTYSCQDWAPHMTYKVVCLALEVGKHEFDHS